MALPLYQLLEVKGNHKGLCLGGWLSDMELTAKLASSRTWTGLRGTTQFGLQGTLTFGFVCLLAAPLKMVSFVAILCFRIDVSQCV